MGTKVLLADSQDSSIYVKLVLPSGQAGYVQRSSVQTKPLYLVPDSSQKALAEASARTTQIAKQLIGTPYLWGGTTPFGLDCSGLVQLCYKMCGVSLRRNSYMQMGDQRFLQVESGKSLNQAEFKAGDLLGFGPSGKVNHIGIALGDGRFIHASGSRYFHGSDYLCRGCVYIESVKEAVFVERFLKAVRLSSAAAIESA
jgi:cell wall-associated NlpC family hydrolase